MSLFGRKNKLPVGEQMKSFITEIESAKHDYYLNLIISLLEGSHRMGMPVINLEAIKGHYKYYAIDDTIVYYDDDIKEALLDKGIASELGSHNCLIITTADYKVQNQREL